MRSFNRARLIDLADKNLNPNKAHILGKDGRLKSSNKQQSLLQQEEKQEELPAEEILTEAVEFFEESSTKEEISTNAEASVAVNAAQEKMTVQPAVKKLPKKKAVSKV